MISKKYKQNRNFKKFSKIPKRTILKCGIFLLSLAQIILAPLAVHAWSFDPNNVLTDTELRDKNSLSKTAIQIFFEREGSVLKNFQESINGALKSASQIIWEVSQTYNVSPKFLLATMEKEKGLIQKTQATTKDTDWATGYSCFNNTCNEKYRGFFNQVESTAITQNIYFDKFQTFQFKPNQPAKTKDGYTVTPKNQATANLYIYTPYIGYAPDYGYPNIENGAGKFGANYLFWQIWTRYFTDKKIPNGFTVKNNDSFWLIENGKKRKFSSKDIFLKDYKESEAIFVNQKMLDAFEDSPIIQFANNTLVRSYANNQAYLLMNGAKRPIIDNAALALLKDFRLAIASAEEVPLVETEKLDSYAVGNPIDSNSKYPQGKLFKDPSGQIIYVQDGFQYSVDNAVWQINFYAAPPEPITSSGLNAYISGSPLKIKNGVIVKNSQGFFYLISDGEKIKIKNPEIGPRIFGDELLQTAIVVSDSVLSLHKDGLNVSFADDTIVDPPTTVSPSPTPTQGYAGDLYSMNPESIVMFYGQKRGIEIKIKNSGSAGWGGQGVWLEAEGKNIPIYFHENSVSSGQTATFSLELDGIQKIGLQTMQFNIYYQNNNQKQTLLSFGKFILVKSDDTAEIVSHDIPIAVKKSWNSKKITMKIKNTSGSTLWLSKKTALEIYDGNDKTSLFYDPSDWVRKEVAAVPIKKSSIKPGETGEFTFVIKFRDVKPGTYTMKFKLHLIDKNKQVFLNGEEYWLRQIRIDK